MAENSYRYDLLGDWAPETRTERGRPGHVVTVENKRQIQLMMAFGEPIGQIAAALRVSVPTLRKHYFSAAYKKEQKQARARVRALNLMMLWDAADAGNVSAMKAVQARLERADLVALERQFAEGGLGEHPARPKAPRKVREQPVGKKEVAAGSAHEAELELAREGLIRLPSAGHA